MHLVLLTLALAAPVGATPMLPRMKAEPGVMMSPRLKAETEVSWEKVCASYKDVPIPQRHQPTNVMTGCSSEKLYYGIGIPRDPELARQCAYQERASGGPVIGGAGVLMMIYANGFGVARDKALALRFACELHGAEAEMKARIEHLLAFEGDDFDLCQDITSGYMAGFCSQYDKDIADLKRQERQQKATDGITGANKVLLNKLLVASRDFIETRIRNEVDLSGTLRAAMMINEETNLEEDFLQMLERYKKGNPNRYTRKDLIDREARMEAALLEHSTSGWAKG